MSQNKIFSLGIDIFTTLLANPRLNFFDEHWQRLCAQAMAFGYLVPPKELVAERINNALHNNTFHKRVRIIISKSDYAITIDDFVHPGLNIYTGEKINVIISSIKVHDYLAGFKTSSYMPYFLAQQEAKRHDAFEALLCNHERYVVDASKCGFFLFNDNIITSPKGGLESIMRKKALSIAQGEGVVIQEKFIKPHELNGQLFLTNSLLGVIPVGKVTNKTCQKIVDALKTI